MQGGPLEVGALDLSLAKHSFVCAPQLALALLVCANCGELTELIGESLDWALGSEAWHLGPSGLPTVSVGLTFAG